MSSRQKYLTVLSRLAPAGAVGISLALGAATPADASVQPDPATAAGGRVAERLAAVRDAVSEVAGAKAKAADDDELSVAWYWRNYGWGFPNFRNWPNGWHNWGNWFRNW